ncbi:ATP-binding protein [Leptolyngbya sp. BL0902]|uniref:ATP-binding protein n=1 Tax=Leptolyngbya sp. BL0902 TaxID=1115757 RepID=UPI0018E72FC6|nr:anti-sigma regulatory factor [Leptolyngbya sp. BL0902]QQE65841.1 ATP-binding protein [Leptolyngbya sp. BL0902]
MVATSPPLSQQKWGTLSFVSTLYLHPVLDILVAEVPKQWQAEIRLGLQEALVNAAKHGNGLDPSKQVSVKYTATGSHFWWVIADQGQGFSHPCPCTEFTYDECKSHVSDCGRGLYILHQIFDQVNWCSGGRELHLNKRIAPARRLPIIL